MRARMQRICTLAHASKKHLNASPTERNCPGVNEKFATTAKMDYRFEKRFLSD